MKIVHFSHADVLGGAAKTAYRIHQALLAENIDSSMRVLYTSIRDETVHRAVGPTIFNRASFQAIRWINAKIDHWLKPGFEFSSDFFGVPKSGALEDIKDADVIHFHLVTGFLNSKLIKKIAKHSDAALVWTVHDFSSFTGGCHFPGNCDGWRNRCGNCPVLESTNENDISRKIWNRKYCSYGNKINTIIAYSTWAAEQVGNSSLSKNSRIEIIPSVVNPKTFRNLPTSVARQALGLPEDGFFILCYAADFDDPRKGLAKLLKVLEKIHANAGHPVTIKNKPVRLLTVGWNDIVREHSLPWDHVHLNFLPDDRLTALAYQAADVLVCTSLYETGPQTIVESMMCGTPVVSSPCGLSTDIVEDGVNGYVVPIEDTDEFATKIIEVLSADNPLKMSASARRAAVNSYSPSPVAQLHINLYKDAISSMQL
ncbi:MAG: glycosyltransferase [Rhodospirillales bacterium]|nr:glycosyltransferase [Rhodospirillales bacterium]